MWPDVRHKGLEPSLLSKLDPKSSASTNSANAAEIGGLISNSAAKILLFYETTKYVRNFLS